MKKTKKWITAVVAVLSLGLTSTSVWAGSKQQHRWEGVAIGVGAAIVGSALINHHAYGYHSGPPVAFSFNYRENHRYPSRYCGYRKPHRGGHDDHWRTYDRGHPSMGHRHDRHVHGNRHHGKWQPRDRGPHDDRRGHSRGHGRPRY
ncbi:MAG: hypothetical protein KFF68_01910 [Desulfosarcina sp.]|nr:hypothetical protein [Desulfosarcina sp.]